VAASLALRFSLFDFQSGDYRAFLSNWYDSFVQHGRWHGLGDPATHFPGYCYPPLYLYLISLSTLLPVPKLYAIKLLSVAADYVAAWYAWRLGRQAGFSPARSWAMVAAVLFLPTVVLNSALWGQCDMMYACALLASLYYILEGRTAAALVAFGLSISVKPQAIIWCPFLAGLVVNGRLPWRQLWSAPSVHITCAVPAMLVGQPVLYALGCWVRPAVAPTTLVQGAPNWCLFMSPDVTAGAYAAGVLLTLLTTAALVWWMWRAGRVHPATTMTAPLTPALSPSAGARGEAVVPSRRSGAGLAILDLDRWLVSAALLSALLPPFLLPGMHERYFFAADVLSVVYAFYDPRRWFVPVLIQFASGFSYFPYLFGQEPVPRLLLVGAMVLAIECVAIRVVQFAAMERGVRKGGIP
jgi:Gpi18-like mannosyltransferase